MDDELFAAYTRAKRSVLDVRPLPGAVEALRLLRSGGIRVAVLTNGPGPFQRLKLSAASLTEELDAVAISAELGWAKPERAAYHGALRLLGTRGEETAMVGDSLENDVVGALRAGIAAAVWLDSSGRRDRPVEGLTASSLAGAVAALGLDTV